MKKIVVIGGGHGQSVILRGIRDIADIAISAIVTVADDGGSTGRIRQKYSIPAMGDIRNVMVAMAESETLISDLMDYRFEGDEADDIVGHSLGNLILTALTNMTGSFQESISIISDALKLRGDIYPSTLETITLYACMDDDTIVRGEANIPSFNHRISRVFYDHYVSADKEAVQAILDADYVVYGIGSLYTSILSNTIIPAISEALRRTKAKRIYFANCMTQSNETYNYTLEDHIAALRKHNTPVDLIFQHSETIPEDIRERYLRENSIEVISDGTVDIPVIRRELLSFDNNLVRHSPDKIRKLFVELLKED